MTKREKLIEERAIAICKKEHPGKSWCEGEFVERSGTDSNTPEYLTDRERLTCRSSAEKELVAEGKIDA